MNREQFLWYINHFALVLVPWLSAATGVFLVSVTPIGRAVIDRLRAGGKGQRQALLVQLDEMRQSLGEVHERLDFAERALARHRQEKLPGQAEAPAAEARVVTPV